MADVPDGEAGRGMMREKRRKRGVEGNYFHKVMIIWQKKRFKIFEFNKFTYLCLPKKNGRSLLEK